MLSDPLPASVLTKCLLTLLPVITDVVNSSLEEAFMPNAIKCAMTKSNVGHEEFKGARSRYFR